MSTGNEERVVRLLKGERAGTEGMVLGYERSRRGSERLWLKVYADWMPPFAGRWYREDEVADVLEAGVS